MENFNEKLYLDGDGDGFEVNYTNAKGFYQYLTKNIELISEFRLRNDYMMWFKALDCMFIATVSYWNNEEETKEYEAMYERCELLITRENSFISSKSKTAYNFKVNKLLRTMNLIISKNTAHLMIKLSQPDEDDSKAWREIFGEDS